MNKAFSVNVAVTGGLMVCGHHVFTQFSSCLYNRVRNVESNIRLGMPPHDSKKDHIDVIRETSRGCVGQKIVNNFHVVKHSETIAIQKCEHHVNNLAPLNSLDNVRSTTCENACDSQIRLFMQLPQTVKYGIAIENPYRQDESWSKRVINGLDKSQKNDLCVQGMYKATSKVQSRHRLDM